MHSIAFSIHVKRVFWIDAWIDLCSIFFFTKLHIIQLDDATGGEDVLVIDDAEGENIVTTDTARLESVVVYVRT